MEKIPVGGRIAVYRKAKPHRLPVLEATVYRQRTDRHIVILQAEIAILYAVDTQLKFSCISNATAADLDIVCAG